MAGALERFRRLAPPGAALPGGAVPVDPREAAAAELAPVFAAAAAASREAQQVIAAAHARADRLRDEARAAATAMLEAAAIDADRARADAAERVRTERVAAQAALLAEAQRQVETIERRADAERAQLVRGVTARLRRIGTEARA